jgi:hypothetical protein
VRRRSRVLAFGGSALLVLAGIACAVVLGGTFGQVLAFILIAGGLVLATSLVFLEVGLSEDRDRDRERERQLERDREPEREPERRGRLAASNADRPVRLSRLRGERRRLK